MPKERKRYKPKSNPNKLTAADLTRGEKLYLDRRRFRWSQAETAVYFGVPRVKYMRWERGEITEGVPYITLGKITRLENCMILRRRAGKTMKELAQEIGVHPWTLRLMERGDVTPTRLFDYWKI